jgi:hypothetical protein
MHRTNIGRCQDNSVLNFLCLLAFANKTHRCDVPTDKQDANPNLDDHCESNFVRINISRLLEVAAQNRVRSSQTNSADVKLNHIKSIHIKANEFECRQITLPNSIVGFQRGKATIETEVTT